MAITLTTLAPYKHGWAISAYSANLTACEELQAAPGAGIQILLRYIQFTLINPAGATQVTVGSGEAANNVEAVLFGPIYVAAATAITYRFDFGEGLLLPANKSLTIDADAAAHTDIYAAGDWV